MKLFLVAALALSASALDTRAQTAPSALEVSRFSPLFQAAHAGDEGDIARALADDSVDVTDEKARTAAHIAAFASNDAALQALAAAGIDMNALDYQRYDVVTIAAVADDPGLIELAIELGARPDLITSIYDGTALIAAAHLGHHKVVEALIVAGAPLDHVNNLGWTALMEAVVLGDGGPDHVECVRLLLEAGADRGIADRNGVTPLAHASASGYDRIVALLQAQN